MPGKQPAQACQQVPLLLLLLLSPEDLPAKSQWAFQTAAAAAELLGTPPQTPDQQGT
jgi:hypothetical protein